jgi:hypothetical protein
MNQNYSIQQYTAQFIQEVIPVVVGLAFAAMVLADAIKAIKEALRK